MTKGRLHSIETFSAVDGPGIRTVFFMQGCPARCIYCHNPDTWKINSGNAIDPEEIVKKALRSKIYFAQKGGVTFSGGEPLMQGEFLSEAIDVLHKENINVCIDTSGTYVDKFTEEAIRKCDLLLLDIKHTDPEKFNKICSCNQELLLQTINYINNYNKPVWVRQVIVPGINDTEKNIYHLQAFTKSKIKNLNKIELLGYHTMALDKYKKLGIKYKLDGVKPLDASSLEALSAKIKI